MVVVGVVVKQTFQRAIHHDVANVLVPWIVDGVLRDLVKNQPLVVFFDLISAVAAAVVVVVAVVWNVEMHVVIHVVMVCHVSYVYVLRKAHHSHCVDL